MILNYVENVKHIKSYLQIDGLCNRGKGNSYFYR